VYIFKGTFKITINYKSMGSKKRKKKKEIKWFPENDLFATILIVIIVGAIMLIKACNG